MVIDSLNNLEMYSSLNSRFAKVVEYIKSNDWTSLPEGKYEILGKEIILNINERSLKTKDQAALEVHDQYIDIQILISGEDESFGWSERKACSSPRGEMDTVKDILFFDDKPQMYFSLTKNQMVIFFPEDAHAPLVGDGKVKKAIFKILV